MRACLCTSLPASSARTPILGLGSQTALPKARLAISLATLLGVVILKLFLVDLSRTGTILRIVSFLGVGVLMLIIGYVSPIPPRRPQPSA